MGMKIFAFPVRGRRWCFSSIVPDVPAGKYGSAVTISQLWERLQSLPQFTDRAELIESCASAKLDSLYRCKRIGLNSEPNPIGSIRHWMYSGTVYIIRSFCMDRYHFYPFLFSWGACRRVAACLCRFSLRPMYFSSGTFSDHMSNWRALQSSTRLKMLLTEGETEASTAEINEAPQNSSQKLSWVYVLTAIGNVAVKVFTPSKELES